MITPELIARINELARKQKSEGLTTLEKEEQAVLRRIYIDNIKSQVKAQLDGAVEHNHSGDCSCGCHHKH
jgi:uncharacterized protein YnzC (UPF0291/DUF896 family)